MKYIKHHDVKTFKKKQTSVHNVKRKFNLNKFKESEK